MSFDANYLEPPDDYYEDPLDGETCTWCDDTGIAEDNQGREHVCRCGA